MAPAGSQPKFRVLHVPDMYSWVTWTIAEEYSRHNPWIEPTICSLIPLRDLLAAHGRYPGEVDLVHFHVSNNAPILIDHFEAKVPCVATIHHVESEQCYAIEPRCDAVTTASGQWYRHLLGLGVPAEKLVQVSYGVDTEKFRPAWPGEKARLRHRLGLPADAIVVGFSAKRTSDSSGRKGIDTLVKVMAETSRRIPQVALLMIGPGWGDIVAWLAGRGMRCLHIPFVYHWDDLLGQLYRSLDIYWITSRIEGGPVPLLEAMSSGICCITTPVGKALDVVRDGESGMIVPFDDVTAFVEQTARLARDPDLRRRVGHNARRTMVEGNTWGAASRSLWQLYKTAVDRFRSRPGVREGPTISGPPSTDGRPVRLARPALASLSDPTRSWVTAREHLGLMLQLRAMGEFRAMRREAFHAIAARPFDSEIIRFILSDSRFQGLYRTAKRLKGTIVSSGSPHRPKPPLDTQ
jgi:glycosyltransferase involved in cell wall biosynthesis